MLESRRSDNNDGDLWMKGLDFASENVTWNILQATVEDDSTDCRKTLVNLKRLSTAVRRENVEFGGFYDEFPG